MGEASISFRKPPQVPTHGSGPVSFLRVKGMTCGNCARRVADALSATPGVASADVDLAHATARIRWKPGIAPSDEALVRALQHAGYPATAGAHPTPPKAPGWDSAWTLGLPALGILGVGDWILGLGMKPWFQWVSCIVALGLSWVLGRPFVQGAWAQARSGGSNMDTLVSLGMAASLGYSLPALVLGWHGHLFFTEVVALLALVGSGHHLERRMSERTSAALRALMDMAPQRARRIRADGSEQEVPVDAVKVGDRLLLRPGDRVPVDAQATEGHGSIDESLLTGESVPVTRRAGDLLCAGTTNLDGRFVVQALAVGEDTALARIAEIVRRAQSTRASVQRMADRISAVFVPAVILVALATALAWGMAPDAMRDWHEGASRWLWTTHLPGTPWATGIYVACAVLVVACPCAMGLATPVALMAGVNVAARRGILVRDAKALETCGRLDMVIFDKTGTLTRGQPAVVGRQTLTPALPGDAHAESWAASLAAPSSHPLSRALAAMDPRRLPVDGWREEAGSGVQAMGGGRSWMLGSAAWLRAEGVPVDAPRVGGLARQMEAEGSTPVLLAMDRQVVALFALRDSLRPEAWNVVQRLRARGLRVGMISGDRPEVALAIGRDAGIDPAEVRAGVRPDGKVACIEALRREGRVMAFVGDGNNDGPALAAANLGMAVSRATDVAREAAGLVLLRDRLEAVEEAVDLAAATLRTIRQNLFWAFFYNAAAVPLAALGMVSPALCAAAMGASDLMVVGNALRLMRYRAPAPTPPACTPHEPLRSDRK